ERYATIVLNQPITRDDVFRRAWRASSLRICADGGANRLHDHLNEGEREEYLPDLIKGDLDSLRPDVRRYYADRGVQVKQDKDEYSTDLMKCVTEVEEREAGAGSEAGEQIPTLLMGGLSGRVDQTVHTMSLLHKLRGRRSEVYVLNGESVAWVLDEGSHLIEIDHKTMGQTCGILPVGVDSAVVKTEGLKWDLDGETSMDGLLSTSNHLLPENPAVCLRTSRPVLWCIEIKDPLP
ncbi:thiamine pyrophosphokinase, partial [Dioszegia hungarica]